ncbi:ferredoxin [Sphingomonas sp. 1185]|uniref:ferredoxin n=1 Tax=Sphingomonas sp. 1185 TaxID=3156411 RepID=UPI003391176E
MGWIILRTQDGRERRIEAAYGLTVMDILKDAGVDDLLALCGGCCSCATCHIYVGDNRSGRLPPMSEDENDLLDSTDNRTAGSRLSCQLPFDESLNGLRISIAPDD